MKTSILNSIHFLHFFLVVVDYSNDLNGNLGDCDMKPSAQR